MGERDCTCAPDRTLHRSGFIDYLANNEGRLPAMDWLKFEELAAEFFDGRAFESSWALPATMTRWTSACGGRRTRGCQVDVQHEGSEYGVLVTTSKLAPGARKAIKARGYPIRDVDREALGRWLQRLRTPGTGIVRV
jgi:restriction system protein